MRYPNLRYGNPTEFRHYAQHMPIRDLARLLRRSERTVQDWLHERQRIPFWVPELLRLRDVERVQQLRHMGILPTMRKLGIVSGDVVRFPAPKTASDCHAASAHTPGKLLRHG